MKRQRLWARVQNGPGRSARRAGARLKQKFEIWLSKRPEACQGTAPPAEHVYVAMKSRATGSSTWRPPGYYENLAHALRHAEGLRPASGLLAFYTDGEE